MTSPMTPASARKKPITSNTSTPTSSSVLGDLLPLLFAAHPELKPNYRRMAELSSGRFTNSAIEHRFRDVRAHGNKIRQSVSAEDGSGKPEGASAGACGSSLKRKNGADGELDDTPTKKPRVNKKGTAKPVVKKKVVEEDEVAKEERVKKENDFVRDDGSVDEED